MQPVDQELTFEGHPDQARPLEDSELFGIRIQGGVETMEDGWRVRIPLGDRKRDKLASTKQD